MQKIAGEINIKMYLNSDFKAIGKKTQSHIMTATYTISIIIRMSHLVEEAHTAAPSFSVAYQSWAHGSLGLV